MNENSGEVWMCNNGLDENMGSSLNIYLRVLVFTQVRGFRWKDLSEKCSKVSSWSRRFLFFCRLSCVRWNLLPKVIVKVVRVFFYKYLTINII